MCKKEVKTSFTSFGHKFKFNDVQVFVHIYLITEKDENARRTLSVHLVDCS